jgi:hypothetical protein
MGEACLIRRLQQAWPQCSVHPEHGVHYLLGNLLDLFFRLIHLLFPSRSSRLRGKKWNPLDMFRARAIVLVRIVRPLDISERAEERTKAGVHRERAVALHLPLTDAGKG